MWMVVSSPKIQLIRNSIATPGCGCHPQVQPTRTRISFPLKLKCQQQETTHSSSLQPKTQDDGIPVEDVKTLAKFKSRYNYIRVLEVSRKADHPFRGSRLLLLDGPGNIHSISFLFKTLTNTYFDVFATLPPIVPPGPIAVLGFGAGSAARVILDLYPDAVVHGWELDPSVIEVAREYFNLARMEREHRDRLFIYVGNALTASLAGGFSGILVDLFSKGSLIPELQEPATWEKLSTCLRKGGRIMVNVGGSCVEAENKLRDGKVVMEQTLKAMRMVFGEKLFVLRLGNRGDDSSLALTGDLPKPDTWKNALRPSLRYYVDSWTPYSAEGEAWGLLEAVQWIIAAGIPQVIFEMDSKQVVEDVHNAKSNKSEYGSIIDKCRLLLSMNNEYQVVFTRQQANGSAHALAKASILNATCSDFHYISGCIVSIIAN